MKNFHIYNDPGHGWIKVPLELLVELGIAHLITGYSYMTTTHAYLEEDCDMGTFIKAMNERNIPFMFVDHYTNHQSSIRSMEPYRAALVKGAFKNGMKVMFYDKTTGTLSFHKDKVFIHYRNNPNIIEHTTKKHLLKYVAEVLEV
jgi:hypothetical protein